MAASSWSYRSNSTQLADSSPVDFRTTSSVHSVRHQYGNNNDNDKSAVDDEDDILGRQLAQARLQRTGFYRRLAEAGSRRDDLDVPGGLVDVTSSRRRQRIRNGTSDGDAATVRTTTDKVSADTTTAAVTLPEPHTSWRYYTSYDNGEWRRHATPVYKSDLAEQEAAATSARWHLPSMSSSSNCRGSAAGEAESSTPAAATSGGLSKPSMRARQSTVERLARLRGSAGLATDGSGTSYETFRSSTTSPPLYSGSGTTGMNETSTKVKIVADDLLRELPPRYSPGGASDMSELLQKILGDRLSSQNLRGTEPPAAERVIYANPERRTICDNLPDGAAAAPTVPEIPEGTDESSFVEKTITPSGRPWTSSPPTGRRAIYVAEGFDGTEEGVGMLRVHCIDGEEQDEDVEQLFQPTETVESTVEKWMSASCKSHLPFDDVVKSASAALGIPGGRRGFLTSETTTREETHTMTSDDRSASGGVGLEDRHRGADGDGGIEIKVQVQGLEKPDDRSTRTGHRAKANSGSSVDERNSAVERWLNACTGDEAVDVQCRGAADGVEVDSRLWSAADGKNGELRNGGLTVSGSSKGISEQKSSSVTAAGELIRSKTAGTADDGVIWIPVIRVAGGEPTLATAESHPSSSAPTPTVDRRDSAAAGDHIRRSSQSQSQPQQKQHDASGSDVGTAAAAAGVSRYRSVKTIEVPAVPAGCGDSSSSSSDQVLQRVVALGAVEGVNVGIQRGTDSIHSFAVPVVTATETSSGPSTDRQSKRSTTTCQIVHDHRCGESTGPEMMPTDRIDTSRHLQQQQQQQQPNFTEIRSRTIFEDPSTRSDRTGLSSSISSSDHTSREDARPFGVRAGPWQPVGITTTPFTEVDRRSGSSNVEPQTGRVVSSSVFLDRCGEIQRPAASAAAKSTVRESALSSSSTQPLLSRVSVNVPIVGSTVEAADGGDDWVVEKAVCR